jgi:hypothetical protein
MRTGKLGLGVVLLATLACDPGAQAPDETERVIAKALQELPTTGTPELMAYRAQLQADLARISGGSSPLVGDPALESSAQGLFQGNGCSAPWWTNLAGIPVTTLTSTFNNQCTWHDQCYSSGKGTYGLARATCDSVARDKMESHCGDMFARPYRLVSPVKEMYDACVLTANTMYTAVRAFGDSHYSSTACVGGQVWKPYDSTGPGCSSYEPFDANYTRLCTGATGLRADNTIGDNWNGCRGSGCLACTDKLGAYPSYFRNHPLCTANSTCAGVASKCGSACPAPTEADKNPIPPPACKGSGTRDCLQNATGAAACCAGLTCRKPTGSTVFVCLP